MMKPRRLSPGPALARRGSPWSILAGAATLAFTGGARAQVDVNPPLPNVMILLDTSGSMENMLDGNTPESENATCAYSYSGNTVLVNTTTAATGTSPNRWGIAVQALTGSMSPVYNCVSMPRTTGSYFSTEYQIDSKPPYDANYLFPYHRPVIGTTLATACVQSPGVLPGDPGGGVGSPPRGQAGLASDFPANGITTRLLSGAAGTCAFTQFQDGILDSARDMVRFGLMTFDQDTTAGIGVTLPGLQVTSTPLTPFDGNWSYYPGWNGAGSPEAGNPADCTTSSIFEVGARNPAAPPWEGRMMTLPAPAATVTQVESQNDQIQLAINAMRPYGATPTAGMFADAEYYFWTDPAGPQQTDAYVQGNCRDEYIIHITDGAPNLDLRPSCSQTPTDPNKKGVCPYKLPEDIAAELYQGGGGKHSVKTFVIGFAVSTINNVQCSTITPNDAHCVNNDANFAACCELQKIAFSGGTNAAYFADTAGDLNKALGAIIASISQNVTTRTVPAYAPSTTSNINQNNPTTNAALYLSSFAPIPGKPWTGDVQRERYVCTFNNNSYTVPPPVIDPNQGDDFAANLNMSGAQANRQFRTVLATVSGATYPSDGTIRPKITTISLPGVHRDDFLGTQGGTTIGVTPNDLLTLPPAALNLNATSCANTLNTEWLTPNACRDLVLNFALAQPSTDPMPDPTFQPFQARTGYALGAIYHSTPAVIGPPSANLDDESYQTFASQPTVAQRKTVLYVATVDGLLHAFDTSVDPTTRPKSELWSFLPPGVLYGLRSAYPSANPLLLDGAPAVKDVVFDRSKAAGSLLLGTNWHTALVAGFGTGHRGYYALDVTDPQQTTDLTKGPQFLWQLTSMPVYKGLAETELFGQHSATPTITTIYADLDGGGPHEIGVAILPGGSDGAPVGGACVRGASAGNDAEPTTNFQRRNSVQCWAAAGQPVVGTQRHHRAPRHGRGPPRVRPQGGPSRGARRLEPRRHRRDPARLADDGRARRLSRHARLDRAEGLHRRRRRHGLALRPHRHRIRRTGPALLFLDPYNQDVDKSEQRVRGRPADPARARRRDRPRRLRRRSASRPATRRAYTATRQQLRLLDHREGGHVDEPPPRERQLVRAVHERRAHVGADDDLRQRHVLVDVRARGARRRSARAAQRRCGAATSSSRRTSADLSQGGHAAPAAAAEPAADPARLHRAGVVRPDAHRQAHPGRVGQRDARLRGHVAVKSPISTPAARTRRRATSRPATTRSSRKSAARTPARTAPPTPRSRCRSRRRRRKPSSTPGPPSSNEPPPPSPLRLGARRARRVQERSGVTIVDAAVRDCLGVGDAGRITSRRTSCSKGRAKAFGLVLPRGVRIDRRSPTSSYASGHVNTRRRCKYVRARVREGKMIRRTSRATGDEIRSRARPRHARPGVRRLRRPGARHRRRARRSRSATSRPRRRRPSRTTPRAGATRA